MNKSNYRIEQVGLRIRVAMHEMTNKEQQLIRYCLSLGAEIGNYSIHKIAENNEVSPALIVKVAKRCGFSGFKEMKSALIAYSLLPITDMHEELNSDDNTQTVVSKVFNTAINSIQETLSIFDYEALNQAAILLRNAKTIDFYGVGGSGALALDAYHKFLRIGIRTLFVTDSHLMIMSAAILKPGSAVLGFSHSGRSRALIEAFTLARQQGASTIAITNSPHSPLTERADIVLSSIAQGSPITVENSAARIVQLNILDALFVLVAQGSYKQSLQNLDRTIKSVNNLKI